MSENPVIEIKVRDYGTMRRALPQKRPQNGGEFSGSR